MSAYSDSDTETTSSPAHSPRMTFDPLPLNAVLKRVRGTYFTGRGRFGDFYWMVAQSKYEHCLFLFNDNEEAHSTCTRGAGNAIMRCFNCYSDLVIPRSAGIPTGTLFAGGYAQLTDAVRATIDSAIDEIKQLIDTHRYDTIYYSMDPTHPPRLGTGLFTVSPDVLDYITDRILELEVIMD